MRGRAAIYLLMCVFFAPAACSDSAVGSQADGGDDSSLRHDDGGIPDIDKTTSALQAVVSSLALPSSAGEFGADLNGDNTPDNALGNLLLQVGQLAPDLSVSDSLATALADGTLVLLFDVFADSLTTSTTAVVEAHSGVDGDGDPSDNFSGSEVFTIAPTSAKDLILSGAIAASRLSVRGKLIFPVSLLGVSASLSLERAQVVAQVSAGGMNDGTITGAIPKSEIDGTFAPIVADEINKIYPGSDPLVNTGIRFLIDTNRDDVVTSAEAAALFQPDIDLSGNGSPDAMSFGLGFTAVSCVIAR